MEDKMPSTKEQLSEKKSKRVRTLKGLILSGGKGSRLRPFTYTSAKQLVPIANKPVLFYTIEQLVECGITDIAIVVGDTADQIRAAVGDGSAFGASVEYIQQDAPLGIAHAVKIARDYMGETPFVLYLGDNFLLGGVKPFVDSFRENGANCQILLHPVKNPQAFGIAELVDGRVTRIVEKPASPSSNLAVIGVYMFDQHVFEAVERIKPSARGELEITDTIQYFIDKGLDVQAELLDRYWIDTGKMDDILEANRMVLQSLAPSNQGQMDERTRVYEPVILEKGASVVNSVLRGPLVIGEETEIIDSYVGPFTTIDHHCRLKGVRVEGSIILENTSIEDIHWPIDRSLIGRHVTLRGGQAVGGSYSLTLGDHSEIGMPEG
jgi:glucose-1-phosphate thymidylyltransferase